MASRKQRKFYLVAATCGLLIYIGFKISLDSGSKGVKEFSQNLGIDDGQLTLLNMSQEVVERRIQKVVIILSNQRSGSSFVGDFFAYNPSIFYSFEPLHPYGTSCTNLHEEKLRLLKNISRCDFSSLRQDYRDAYFSSGAEHDECLRNNVCFLHKQKATLERYFKLCERRRLLQGKSDKMRQNRPSSCGGNPVDLRLWTQLCRSSGTLVYKILRICSVKALEHLDEYLASIGNKLYVIELVRDPRGIINSALKLELKRNRLNKRLNKVCGQFDENIIYTREQKMVGGRGIVSEGRYKRVRFEDIAEDPKSAAEKLYRFIGESVPVDVKLWLEKSTIGSSPVVQELEQKLRGGNLPSEEMIKLKKEITRVLQDGNSPYGTTRNSSNIPLKWRRILPIDIVKYIQRKCGNAMTKLGYKIVQTEEEKKNLTIKLW